MSATSTVVGAVLPYFAILAFFGGVAYRLIAWRRVPQPALMTLYPRQGNGALPLLREGLFMPSLRSGDRTLWLLAWTFHAALAVACVGHGRVLTSIVDRALMLVGVSAQGLDTLSTLAGGGAGVILFVTLMLFLTRRIFVRRAREVSSPPDFLALALLLAVVTSGNLMRLGSTTVDLAQTRTWAVSLLALSPVVPSTPGFLLHLFCAELLLVYVAFSKLMHMGGFFFTFSLLKRSAS